MDDRDRDGLMLLTCTHCEAVRENQADDIGAWAGFGYCDACAAKMTAYARTQRGKRAAVTAHRAAVLDQAARDEPPGRIPLDDWLDS